MNFQVVAMTCDHPLYQKVFSRIEGDAELNRLSWEHTESVIAQHLPVHDALTGEPGWPARCWWMALAGDDEPMAWAAAQLTWQQDGDSAMPVLLMRNSFHVPRFYGEDVYPHVFHAREAATRHLPAVTYVFRDILDLHLEAGWTAFKNGISREPGLAPHHWWGLRRGW